MADVSDSGSPPVSTGQIVIIHNYQTEGFQKPIKPLLFENLDLFGNPVVTLLKNRITYKNNNYSITIIKVIAT